jgi:phosphate:Na+ symporter
MGIVGSIIFMIFKLGGALALFMYGMQLSSDGIQRAAGERLQRAVNMMTRNRFVGVITGIVVTVLLQSSSATTVMVVSFVNAGLLSLVQSIGVIMGSNIGTTLTGWIIAAVGLKKFSIVILAVPVFGVGYLMTLLKRRGRSFTSYGEAMMGFSLIFLGLEFLAEAIPDPSGNMLEFLAAFADKGALAIFVCVMVGVVFTMLINASSATIAITISMASKGILTFPMAAAITLGAHIGTCFDSFLISLRTNANARRAAYAHLLFNIFGAAWVLAIFKPFISFVDFVTPGVIGPGTVGVHIAMLHTISNTANTFLLLPFTRQYAKFLTWLIREKKDEAAAMKRSYEVIPLVRSPELNIVHARNEISHMAGMVGDMFGRYCEVRTDPPKDMETELDKFKAWEEYADSMREGLTRFLLDVTEQDLAEATRESIAAMLRVVIELENITDSCFNLAIILDRQQSKKLTLDSEEVKRLDPYTRLVQEFLLLVKDNAASGITEEGLKKAVKLEDLVNESRIELKKLARRRLKAGADVKAELTFIDIVRHIEKIGDFAFSASEALREMR